MALSVARPAGARELLASMLPALVLAVAATAACRAVAGVSLGLFFGGVAVATLLVPPLTAAESSTRRRVMIPALVALAVALVWLTALGDLLRLNQWIACSVVLVTYGYALAGVCSLLLRARWNPAIGAGCVTVLGLLWLTWPVWLSAALLGPAGETLVGWLVPAHPLFAINGVLSHFDSWDRYPLAYRQLTVLNQDVFYEMPKTVLWAVLAHAMLAAATFGAVLLAQRRRPARDPS